MQILFSVTQNYIPQIPCYARLLRPRRNMVNAKPKRERLEGFLEKMEWQTVRGTYRWTTNTMEEPWTEERNLGAELRKFFALGPNWKRIVGPINSIIQCFRICEASHYEWIDLRDLGAVDAIWKEKVVNVFFFQLSGITIFASQSNYDRGNHYEHVLFL